MSSRTTGIIAVTSYLLLLTLVFSWIVWFLPPTHWPRPMLLLIAVLPLAIPLRGLLHGRIRSFYWAAFLSLVYALHGGGDAWADPGNRWLGLSELILAVTVFTSATLHIRAKNHEAESEE